jgi:hypothetical protein
MKWEQTKKKKKNLSSTIEVKGEGETNKKERGNARILSNKTNKNRWKQ